MASFHAVYYRAPDGAEPVRAFLDDIDDEIAAVLALQIERLNLLSDQVPHLPFPHSSQVDGELRELRCHYGRQLYRVLYRRSDRLLVLLHIFSKADSEDPCLGDQDRQGPLGRLQGADGRRPAHPSSSRRPRRTLMTWFAELLT